jgi:uncharacterized protein YuzE
MPTAPAVSVQVDTDAGAAYLKLSAGAVDRTVEFTEDIYVDLDRFGVVVGIELIDLETSLPLDQLASRFHISSETLELLINAIRWGTPGSVLTSANPKAEDVSYNALHIETGC